MMPIFLEFYPGFDRDSYYALRIDEFNEMVRHMERARRAQARGANGFDRHGGLLD